MLHLQEHMKENFNRIMNDVHNELPKWNRKLLTAQKDIALNCIINKDKNNLEDSYTIKFKCHVRLDNVPTEEGLLFPNHSQLNLLREVKGTVIRIKDIQLLEIKRDFSCLKCGFTVTVNAEYSLMYRFEVPKECTQPKCNGKFEQKNTRPLPNYCINYQEITIQQPFGESNIPKTILVTLDYDLVNLCQPGDCVTI